MPVDDLSGRARPALSIARDGGWCHEGKEITHERTLAHLWDSLREDGSGHYLQLGSARVPVAVEDAPFVVVRVELGDGGAALVLSDGSREPLAVETLRLGPGEVPYCRVKDGRFTARLSRAAAWQLLQAMEPDAVTGDAVLVLGHHRRAIPRAPSR